MLFVKDELNNRMLQIVVGFLLRATRGDAKKWKRREEESEVCRGPVGKGTVGGAAGRSQSSLPALPSVVGFSVSFPENSLKISFSPVLSNFFSSFGMSICQLQGLFLK